MYSTIKNVKKKKPNLLQFSDEKYKSKLFLAHKKSHGGLRVKKKYKDNSNKKNPLITIITVVLNNDKFIEECILSVLNQKYSNIEYIIIDGESKDNTIQIIKKYEKYLDYWVSAKDKGIYDAFNKGLELATGNIIGFVNSDDVLTPNGLSLIISYFKKYKKADFIFGAVKKHYAILHGYKSKKIFYSWGFYSSHSTGFYIKSESAKLIGPYNTKYKYSADYDYFYRMIVHHKQIGYGTKKSELVGIFRRGGYSSTVSFKDHFKEEIKIRLDNKQNRVIVLIIGLLKFLKNFKKFI
jgi:glycosyltransferase involved in cell wall biosynthesis